MKVKVQYILETEYDFNDEQLSYFPDEYETIESWARGWIKEDFYKVENRADNVLPPYTSRLHFNFNEQD